MTVSFHLGYRHLPASPQRMLQAKLRSATLFDQRTHEC